MTAPFINYSTIQSLPAPSWTELFSPRPKQQSQPASQLPAEWDAYLRALFPSHTRHPFAAHHADYWRWLWAVEPGKRPAPFVGIWPRGGAKSSSAEMGTVVLGAKEQRHYGLYVCATQEAADNHVQTVGEMLESAEIAAAYPLMSDRSLGKFGTSKGWRRNRLWTASNFIVDAVGLDQMVRGLKLGSQRPDFMVFDDMDDVSHSLKTIEDNIVKISQKILPAGSDDCAVLAIQNVVIPNGVFARLGRYDGAPQIDILTNRILSGPLPALYDMEYESHQEGERTIYRITSGMPSWLGQDRATCEAQMNAMGPAAFLREAQHEVDAADGGMFGDIDFRHIEEEDLPALLDGCVWIDPAVTDTDSSDACGVSAASLGVNGVTYIRRSWEQRSSPLEALKRGISWAMELGIDRVGVETDQGGDTWQSVYQQACYALGIPLSKAPRYVSDKAGAGYGSKAHRAGQMLTGYERGRIVHVLGTERLLERALKRFPKTKPYDLVDATFWCWQDLQTVLAGRQQRQMMAKGARPAVVFEE